MDEVVFAIKENIIEWNGHSEQIDTAFFGGGTPSLLPADSLELLLRTIKSELNCCEDMEITLEANPGTVSLPYLKMLRQIGFNRLSIGVQTFNEDTLKRIGRIHTGNEAVQAVEDAAQAGFENVSVDLFTTVTLLYLSMILLCSFEILI